MFFVFVFVFNFSFLFLFSFSFLKAGWKGLTNKSLCHYCLVQASTLFYQLMVLYKVHTYNTKKYMYITSKYNFYDVARYDTYILTYILKNPFYIPYIIVSYHSFGTEYL